MFFSEIKKTFFLFYELFLETNIKKFIAVNYFFWLLQVTAFPSLIIHYNLQIHSENLMFIDEREIETKVKIMMTLSLFCSKHSKLNLISKRISVNVKAIQLMHLLS